MKINFLGKFESLRKSVPIPEIRSTNNVSCEYIDYGGGNKDCYQTFIGIQMQNSLYTYFSGFGKYLTDCNLCGWSDLCYECVNCLYCYQCIFSYDCTKCRNCSYCSMCIGCTDCFGCVALNHKQHCIFNKQYSKDNYLKKLVELKKLSSQELLSKLEDLKRNTPQPQSHQRENVNCPYGDYLSYSKNVYWGFNTYWAEDSGYIYSGGKIKSSWDIFVVGGGSGSKDIMKGICELCYECVGGGGLYNCAYLYQCTSCTNCYYGWDLKNCSDCVGCVGLSNKKYCILNNQLTKENYEKGVIEIKNELGWKIN